MEAPRGARARTPAGTDDHQRHGRPHRAELDRRRAEPVDGQEHHRGPRPRHGASGPRQRHQDQPSSRDRLAEALQAEDELRNPRALALPDWGALIQLADALVAASHGEFQGWGSVVLFAACTAARIGEVSGCRVGDIDTANWIWTVRRQTTPAPGGLVDKGTKGKRARQVPIIEEIRPLVAQRVLAAGPDPDARLFTGPRGGRISTAVLRDATHWDDVVNKLGYEHLRRHDLRHTGLTWFADAGVPVHVLRKIAGHGSLTTTQRYPHPDVRQITAAGAALTAHLSVLRAPRTLPSLIAVAR
ncbi:site-specific integrase [Streptomyces sp. NPDC048717]|uniref:tyrosine-type recombinase/integrase n=1 Tax=Streptomyces sp. NPDC048717 TaxID=3154928 RepID=UPI0034385691